jgi:hypothetical protein
VTTVADWASPDDDDDLTKSKQSVSENYQDEVLPTFSEKDF